MGLGGSIAGAALGVLAQRLLPGLMAGLLPVQVEPVLSPRAVALGLGTGLWVALVFAAMPLLAVRRVPPLAALRRDVEPDRRRLDPWRIAAAAALAATTVALAALQVGSWRQGAIFSAGVAVALLVLWGASWALIRAARRWLPGGWPYVWRQGLANLHRPVEPDGHRRARDRVRRVPAGDAVPGAVQPAPHSSRDRRTRAAEPRAVRHPAGPAPDGPADARRGRLSGAAGRCRSCRCGSSPSRAAR